MPRRFQFSLWTLIMTASFTGILIAVFKADPLDNRTRAAAMVCCLVIMAIDVIRYLRQR